MIRLYNGADEFSQEREIAIEFEAKEVYTTFIPLDEILDSPSILELNEAFEEDMAKVPVQIDIEAIPDGEGTRLDFWYGLKGYGIRYFGLGAMAREGQEDEQILELIPELLFEEADWEMLLNAILEE